MRGNVYDCVCIDVYLMVCGSGSFFGVSVHMSCTGRTTNKLQHVVLCLVTRDVEMSSRWRQLSLCDDNSAQLNQQSPETTSQYERGGEGAGWA